MNRQSLVLISVICIFILVAGSGAARGQAVDSASAPVLTIEQAVTVALQNNRQVQIKQLSVSKAEDQVAAARTSRLPRFNLYTLGSQQLSQIDFRFEQGVFGTFPGIGPIPDKDTSITSPRKPTFLIIGQITEPISQQYQIGLNIAQRKRSLEIAQEQLRSEQQTVTNDLKRSYYAILQTQSAIQTAQENIRLYRELDRVTGDYVAQQVALKSENLDVKTRLAKAEYNALTLDDQLASQKEQLNNLLGRDIHTQFSVSAAIDPIGFDVDLVSARSRALDRRPEIREARLRLKQAEIDRRIKRSEFIPEVSASFNYISPRNFGSIVPKQIMSVGLVFSWEIFDWGKKRRELDEKGKSIEQATAGLKEAENLVAIDLNAKHRKLQQTRLQLRIAQLTQETARETLRVTTNKYEVRAALLSDVLQSQTVLADANQQYLQAVFSFWTTKADFEKATGEDK